MPTSSILINTSITTLTMCGGTLFTIGSIMYLPALSYVNANVGGVLFIIGSMFYFTCDILGARIEPEFSPLKPFDNIGSLRALLVAIGNIAFIVGSIYFLPTLPSIVGDDIFAVASIFVMIPQALTIFGVNTCTTFTQQYYLKTRKIKYHLIGASVALGVACFLFFIGSVLFKNYESETIGLYF